MSLEVVYRFDDLIDRHHLTNVVDDIGNIL